jgi:hypothetical protein
MYAQHKRLKNAGFALNLRPGQTETRVRLQGLTRMLTASRPNSSPADLVPVASSAKGIPIEYKFVRGPHNQIHQHECILI